MFTKVNGQSEVLLALIFSMYAEVKRIKLKPFARHKM